MVELHSNAPVLAAELCSRSRPPAANPAAAVCVLVIGGGAMRFTAATLGADQFGSARDQDAFFNWYFVSLYGSFLLGDTAIVYLHDSVCLALGFGICLASTVGSLAMLLLRARYYRMPAPEGNNPYTELARVVVAAVRKARVDVDALGRVHYHAGGGAAADYGTEISEPCCLHHCKRQIAGCIRWTAWQRLAAVCARRSRTSRLSLESCPYGRPEYSSGRWTVQHGGMLRGMAMAMWPLVMLWGSTRE